jgi:predicted permease
MTWFTRIFRRTLYNDLAEEMRLHLEEKTEQFVREGMSHEQARQAARRAFGNTTLIEERSREVWQWPRFESIWADTKYALRQLRKSPGISAVAILTLAFGIGANTAIFTLTWNVVLKSLPVPQPGQLVEYEMRNGDNMMGVSGPEFTLLSQRQKSCISLLAWSSDQPSVRQGTQTTPQWVQLLTGNAFQVLQIQPYLGRAFSEEEEFSKTRGVPALLSYDYWQRQFQGNENVLGQTLYVENHPVTIVGVMPHAFDGLTANLHPAIYLPMSFANALFGKDYLTSPGHFGQFVLGRLKPGMTLAAAAAEASVLDPSMRKDADPGGIYLAQFFKDFHLSVRSGRSGVSWVKMTYERSLLVLELLVLFLLILCAVNTALVLMARVSGRRQEYALRAALGASRFSLVRQVLAEAFLLALPGLAVGILLGWLGSHALVAMLGERGATSAMDLRPNRWILAFNLVSTLVIALGAGLVPALRAAQTAPALDLKAGNRSVASARLGGWAVSMQVAVSVCLLSAALFFGNTLAGLLAANGGLVFKGAVAANVGLASLKLTDAQNAGVFARLADALQSRPGVEAVGFTDLRPLSGESLSTSRMFALDSRGNIHSNPGPTWIQATPGLFTAMGIRVLAGRPLASASSSIQNCVLGQSASEAFFPQENPIGRSIFSSTGGKTDGTVLNPAASCRVVAVVQDARYVSLRKPAPQAVYGLLQASAWNSFSANVVVRAGSDPLALDAVRAAIAGVLPDALAVQPRTFTELADQDLSRERTLVSLAGAFALLALLLTALGLYGLLMRAITLRTREIGVRIALGAQRKSILLTIGRDAFVEVVAGLLTGTFVAVLLRHTVSKLLGLQAHSGFSCLDVASYLLAAMLFLLVLLTAVLPPAFRVAGIDPMEALRAE